MALPQSRAQWPPFVVARRSFGSVSYTHLDVYKRQAQGELSLCFPCVSGESFFVPVKPENRPEAEAFAQKFNKNVSISLAK